MNRLLLNQIFMERYLQWRLGHFKLDKTLKCPNIHKMFAKDEKNILEYLPAGKIIFNFLNETLL